MTDPDAPDAPLRLLEERVDRLHRVCGALWVFVRDEFGLADDDLGLLLRGQPVSATARPGEGAAGNGNGVDAAATDPEGEAAMEGSAEGSAEGPAEGAEEARCRDCGAPVRDGSDLCLFCTARPQVC